MREIVNQGWNRNMKRERERGPTKVIMVLGEGRNIKGGCGGLWVVMMIICWTFVLEMVLQATMLTSNNNHHLVFSFYCFFIHPEARLI